jgi:SAM-dependent methyltransferase
MSWDEKRVRDWLAKTKFEGYQRIPLPHGLEVPGKDRSPAAKTIFRDSVKGKSVLDVGCNYGYMCHEALARGATSATGIDYGADRISVARTAAEITGGPLSFFEGTVETTKLPGPYDVVLFLNVIHHMPDPLAGMRRIAELARERVVAEFPTPGERLWWKHEGIGRIRRRFLDGLPLVGVATEEGRPQWYFSPEAFRAAFTLHVPVFKKIEFGKSHTKDSRVLAYCTK